MKESWRYWESWHTLPDWAKSLIYESLRSHKLQRNRLNAKIVWKKQQTGKQQFFYPNQECFTKDDLKLSESCKLKPWLWTKSPTFVCLWIIRFCKKPTKPDPAGPASGTEQTREVVVTVRKWKPTLSACKSENCSRAVVEKLSLISCWLINLETDIKSDVNKDRNPSAVTRLSTIYNKIYLYV